MTKWQKRIVGVLVAVFIATLGFSAYAQAKRPYRDGSVWQMNFIRMKPGMETAYLTYIANDWKRSQEAAKKEGLILSYKVITTDGHTPGDWNIVLMTEHKDLATMEANQDKGQALVQRLIGDDQKQMQGYKDRLEIRDIIGDRIGREIVLEPKP